MLIIQPIVSWVIKRGGIRVPLTQARKFWGGRQDLSGLKDLNVDIKQIPKTQNQWELMVFFGLPLKSRKKRIKMKKELFGCKENEIAPSLCFTWARYFSQRPY